MKITKRTVKQLIYETLSEMADPDDYSEFEQGPMTSAAGEAMGGMSVPPESV